MFPNLLSNNLIQSADQSLMLQLTFIIILILSFSNE